MRTRLAVVLVAGMAVSCRTNPPLAHAGGSADYYVATQGSDAWSGTLAEPNPDRTDGPFATLERALAQPLDFYGAYHVPFFATWALCEQAALARALGERDRARALLAPARTRAPGRWWLADEAEAE